MLFHQLVLAKHLCCAKSRVLRLGDLVRRPSKLNVSSTLSTSTPFARVALPQQHSLLVRVKSLGLDADESPSSTLIPQRIYVTYVLRITYLTF